MSMVRVGGGDMSKGRVMGAFAGQEEQGGLLMGGSRGNGDGNKMDFGRVPIDACQRHLSLHSDVALQQ